MENSEKKAFEIIVMNSSHRQDFLELMVNTFLTDPTVLWYFPNEETRAKHLAAYMEVMFNFSNLYCQSYVAISPTNKVHGVLVLMKPYFYITMIQQILSGTLSLLKIGPRFFLKFVSQIDMIEKTRLKIINEPHWRGCFVGVDPAYRKLGVMQAFSEILRNEADKSHHACYVETAKPEIVRIYKQYGFKVKAEIDLPYQGPHVWLLTRPARPPIPENN